MEASKEFQIIPGVGKSLSQDLVDLGYKKVTELKGENPETMYKTLWLCEVSILIVVCCMFLDVSSIIRANQSISPNC